MIALTAPVRTSAPVRDWCCTSCTTFWGGYISPPLVHVALMHAERYRTTPQRRWGTA
jgi:hypothetical protein